MSGFVVAPAKLALYLDRRFEELRQIEAAIGLRQITGIGEISHRIKGNAALFGLAELGHVAARLEELAERPDPNWEEIQRSASELGAGLRAARERAAGVASASQ